MICCLVAHELNLPVLEGMEVPFFACSSMSDLESTPAPRRGVSQVISLVCCLQANVWHPSPATGVPFPPELQEYEQNAITAGVLADALPFIQAYTDKTIVIKYGGHAMENAEASLSFARDVVMLKQVIASSKHNADLSICASNETSR